MFVWKEVKKIKAANNFNSSCIDNSCNTAHIISVFDRKYKNENMKTDCACQSQTSSFDIDQSNDEMQNLDIKCPLFTIEDINISIDNINDGLG